MTAGFGSSRLSLAGVLFFLHHLSTVLDQVRREEYKRVAGEVRGVPQLRTVLPHPHPHPIIRKDVVSAFLLYDVF